MNPKPKSFARSVALSPLTLLSGVASSIARSSALLTSPPKPLWTSRILVTQITSGSFLLAGAMTRTTATTATRSPGGVINLLYKTLRHAEDRLASVGGR